MNILKNMVKIYLKYLIGNGNLHLNSNKTYNFRNLKTVHGEISGSKIQKELLENQLEQNNENNIKL